MKGTIALVAVLMAGLAVGASAQTKLKPGAGSGKGNGNGPTKVTGVKIPGTSSTSGKADGAGKPIQAKPGGHGSGTGVTTKGPAVNGK